MEEQKDQELRLKFNRWKKNDITQFIFNKLKEERERMVDSVIYKAVEEPDVVVGRIQAIDNLLAINFEGVFYE